MRPDTAGVLMVTIRQTHTVTCDLCGWSATIPLSTDEQAAQTWLSHYRTHTEGES